MIPLFCRQIDLLLSLPSGTIDKTGLNLCQEFLTGGTKIKSNPCYNKGVRELSGFKRCFIYCSSGKRHN